MAETWDLAIVGAGTAGLPAAICAARRGARVVLIEAADRIGGTMYLSSGSLSAGGAKLGLARGIEDSAARHHADCVRLGQGSANPDVLRLWVENAPDTVDWLVAEGITFGADQPAFSAAHEAYDAPRTYTPAGGAIAYLKVFEPALQEQIDAGRITLRLSTRMTRLEQDAAGAVIGVRADAPTGEETFFATSVLLTTGGYAQDEALWRRLHEAPHRVYAYAHAKGDGHRAAEALGARLDYADNFLPTYGASQDIDDLEKFWIHSRIAPAFRPPWEVIVNDRGERFMREDLDSPDGRERALKVQPGQAFWVVYDENIRREAPALFLWDEEKIARAFAESPNFQQADTISDLAGRCGIEPGVLEKTIADYNRGQAIGADSFGREHLPAPVAGGPFYAIHHFSTSVVTWGGVVTDGALRVTDGAGKPIPNLYAAGELLGMGVFGHTFLGGSTVSSSITFGRLLGERLAAAA